MEPTLESPRPDTTAPADTRPLEPPAVGTHEMTREQRGEWLKTGKPPAEKHQDAVVSESSTDNRPGERVAPTGAEQKAASETAAADKTGKGKGIKQRNTELDAEIQELQQRLKTRREVMAQLEALERKPTTEQAGKKEAAATGKAPAAQTTQKEYERILAMPDAPRAENYADLDEFAADMSAFVSKKVAEEAFKEMFEAREKQSRTAAATSERVSRLISSCEERFVADASEDPTLESKLNPSFTRIPALSLLDSKELEQVQRENPAMMPAMFIKEQILHAQHPLKLSAYFSTDEGEQHFGTMMDMDPEAIVREVARLDAGLKASASSAAPAALPKQFTKTPAPPTKVGAKPAGPHDPAAAAVAAGDFDAFMAAMDAKEGKTSRRFGRGGRRG